MNRHIIIILLENQTGALARVAGLFSARGYNIESLTVAPTEDYSLSRMTIVTKSSPTLMKQIIKQLEKLIDVIELVELTKEKHIERGMMLVKVLTEKSGDRQEVERLASVYNGIVIDATSTTVTLGLLCEGIHLDSFITSLCKHRILEMVRSGISAIACNSISFGIK